MRRILVGIAVIAALAACVVATVVTYQPPQPVGCELLLQQSEHTSDVGTLLDEAGCPVDEVGHDLTARP